MGKRARDASVVCCLESVSRALVDEIQANEIYGRISKAKARRDSTLTTAATTSNAKKGAFQDVGRSSSTTMKPSRRPRPLSLSSSTHTQTRTSRSSNSKSSAPSRSSLFRTKSSLALVSPSTASSSSSSSAVTTLDPAELLQRIQLLKE